MGNLVCDPAADPKWEYGAFYDKNGTPRPIVSRLKGD
jgi:hypothetical protein